MFAPRILPILLTVIALGCGPQPEPWEEELPGWAVPPITDGTTYNGHPSVGWLHINNSTLCTGTLIGSKTVLTAAHCIQTGKSHVFYVGGSSYTATSTTFHNGFNPTTKDNDIAIVTLATAPTVTPTPISGWAPTVGQSLTLIGYGKTSSGSDDAGTKRTATNTVATVSSQKFTFNGTGGGIGNTCFGDSGGPAFASFDGTEVQVGVTSGGSDPCGTLGVDMRADAYYSWINIKSGGDLVGACRVTLGGSPSPGTVSVGTSVTLTATGTCSTGTPEYTFIARRPDGKWISLRGWGASNTLAWDTTTAQIGEYKVMVKARAQGSTASYEGYSSRLTYTTSGTASTCSAAVVTPTPATAATVGSTVALAAASTCPAGSTPEYKFMVKDTGGVTLLLRTWGTSTSHNWDTTGLPVGTYKLRLFVRQQGSAQPYEAEGKLDYDLTTASSTCVSATTSASPTGSAAAGTTVAVSAISSCPAGSTPEYKFMVKDTGGVTRLLRTWGTSASYNWDTTGQPAGAYKLRVFVRQVGSAAPFEAEGKLDYTLTGGAALCSAASVNPSPATTATVGTIVGLGSSVTCPAGSTPEYKFMVKDTGGVTQLLQNWSTTATHGWNTASLPAGSYRLRLFVRQLGSALPYEVEGKQDYTLTSP